LAFQQDTDSKSDFCSFFVNPRKPWLREMVSSLLQTSMVERTLRKYNIDMSRDVEASIDDAFNPIAFRDFSGVLTLLSVGLSACVLVVIVERFVHKFPLSSASYTVS